MARRAAALEAAEARTAAINAAPGSSPWQRQAAAEQEMQAGEGLWMHEYELEAG